MPPWAVSNPIVLVLLASLYIVYELSEPIFIIGHYGEELLYLNVPPFC